MDLLSVNTLDEFLETNLKCDYHSLLFSRGGVKQLSSLCSSTHGHMGMDNGSSYVRKQTKNIKNVSRIYLSGVVEFMSEEFLWKFNKNIPPDWLSDLASTILLLVGDKNIFGYLYPGFDKQILQLRF